MEDPNTATTSTGDTTATRYYTFGGSTVAVRTNDGKLSLMLGDEQGSTAVVMPVTVQAGGALASATLADAAAVTRTAYTPYGELRGEDNPAVDRGWLGQVEDRVSADGASGTGLTYLNARYYDPATQRFISPDPLMNPGDPNTLDPYRYADNNPVVFTDASGLMPCAGTGAGESKCLEMYYKGTKTTKPTPGKKTTTTYRRPPKETVLTPPNFWSYIPIEQASCGPIPCFSSRASEAHNYPLGRQADFAAQIVLGFTPIGPLLDLRDFANAASSGSNLGMAFSAVGFLPFGDIAKLRRLRAGGYGAPAGAIRTLDEAIAATPRPRGMSDAVARAALQNTNDSGLTVLGRYKPAGGGSNYISRAKDEGASYFNIGVGRFTQSEAELADAYFIRITVAKGDVVLVQGGKQAVEPNTWLSAEVSALTWYGYTWNGDALVPPG